MTDRLTLLTLIRILAFGPSPAAAATPQAPSATPAPAATAPDIAAADALFHQGRAAIAAGRAEEACASFEQSLAIVRRLGVLINLADCREKAGQYATAERLFRQTLDLAVKEGRADREAYARQHITGLQDKLAWLDIERPTGSESYVIRCDDVTVTSTPIAVDPGDHRVVVTGPNGLHAEVEVRGVAAGERRAVRLGPSQTATPAPAPSAAPTASIDVTQTPSLPPRWLRPAGIAAIGVGTAALGVGLALTGRAYVDNQAALVLCPNDQCPTARGLAKNDAARTAALGASIGVPVGLVGLAAGTTLLILARPRPGPARTTKTSLRSQAIPRISPALGPEGGGVWIEGTF